jgi:hypothetical protein
MDNSNNDMTKAYTNHYISLLKYVNDRPKAVKALDLYQPKMQRYTDALNYAKKNGVKTYGVLVYAEAGDLLEFINNEKIKTIEIDNVLASKRYIN